MSTNDKRQAVYDFLFKNGPATMPTLAVALGDDHKIHGRQHYISVAIMRLREEGVIVDVDDRCKVCHRAGRKGRNVMLHLTGLVFDPPKPRKKAP